MEGSFNSMLTSRLVLGAVFGILAVSEFPSTHSLVRLLWFYLRYSYREYYRVVPWGLKEPSVLMGLPSRLYHRRN
jgi:hypothetical protein